MTRCIVTKVWNPVTTALVDMCVAVTPHSCSASLTVVNQNTLGLVHVRWSLTISKNCKHLRYGTCNSWIHTWATLSTRWSVLSNYRFITKILCLHIFIYFIHTYDIGIFFYFNGSFQIVQALPDLRLVILKETTCTTYVTKPKEANAGGQSFPTSGFLFKWSILHNIYLQRNVHRYNTLLNKGKYKSISSSNGRYDIQETNTWIVAAWNV